MKVALVFHGLSYGYNNKGEYSSITQDSFDSIKKRILNKKILEKNKIKYDIFFHSWNSTNNEQVLKIIKPCKYIFEDRRDFSDKCSQLKTTNNLISKNLKDFTNRKNVLESIYSRFYSMYQSIKLLESNGEYDYIIVTRFDIFISSKLNISKSVDP